MRLMVIFAATVILILLSLLLSIAFILIARVLGRIVGTVLLLLFAGIMAVIPGRR